MNEAVAHILSEADQLSAAERAELLDCLIERLAIEPPPRNIDAQVDEVRRRIAQVEAGEIQMVPGDEVMARVMKSLDSVR